MSQNTWPGQQPGGPNDQPAWYPSEGYAATYAPATEPQYPGYPPPAYFTEYGPGPHAYGQAPTGYTGPPLVRPPQYWPLVAIAVVLSGLIGGAVALYFAVQVDRRWAAGDIEGARKASRLAKIWAILGIVVSMLIVFASIGLGAGRPEILNLTNQPAVTTSADRAMPPPAPVGIIDANLEEPANLDRGQQRFFDGMSSDLRQAVDMLNRGTDPTSSCISVLVTADGFATGFEDAAKKATEQCGREIPIAWASNQLDVAAAKNDRLEAMHECVAVTVTLDSVEKRFSDPRVGELRARSNQICR
jgi:hypothetical protein